MIPKWFFTSTLIWRYSGFSASMGKKESHTVNIPCKRRVFSRMIRIGTLEKKGKKVCPPERGLNTGKSDVKLIMKSIIGDQLSLLTRLT